MPPMNLTKQRDHPTKGIINRRTQKIENLFPQVH